MQEENDSEEGRGPMARYTAPVGFVHKFYIHDILSPDNYTAAFETIRNSGETDIIILHINSPGGNMMAALQFLRCLSETPAKIIASVEGACMSAATLFLMAADEHQITDHSMFMFHNYSTGHKGKGGEIWDSVFHEREWSVQLWNDLYKGFLTEEEIKELLNNRDFWMAGPEVYQRIQNRRAVLKQEAEEKKLAENGELPPPEDGKLPPMMTEEIIYDETAPPKVYKFIEPNPGVVSDTPKKTRSRKKTNV